MSLSCHIHLSLWCFPLPDGSQYLPVNCRTVESASTVCGSVASTRYRSPWRNVPQFPSRPVWGRDWSRSARMSHKTSAGNFCPLSILLTRPSWPPPPWPEENGAVNRQWSNCNYLNCNLSRLVSRPITSNYTTAWGARWSGEHLDSTLFFSLSSDLPDVCCFWQQVIKTLIFPIIFLLCFPPVFWEII